jgi:predicted RNA binding protein YcfA (HicA-like mRNA interferase family)
MPKRHPVLTLSEVNAIVANLGFKFKRKEGAHAQWECEADGTHPRSVITVDDGEREFDEFLIKSMIRQSKRTREEFYGATKRTAKRAGVPHLEKS